MSTRLGKTSGSWIINSSIWTNFIYIRKDTIPANSQIVAGGFRGDGNYSGASGSQPWRVIVYQDNGADFPGTLLGVSNDASAITIGTSEQDFSVAFGTPIVFTVETIIWHGIHAGGSGTPCIQVRTDTYSTRNELKSDTFSDGSPNPYGTTGGSNDNNRSMWVDYDPSLALDMRAPDADVVTTGWAATPLFSKVNDSSDATVIQATAS